MWFGNFACAYTRLMEKINRFKYSNIQILNAHIYLKITLV